jgi:hypothetical protein
VDAGMMVQPRKPLVTFDAFLQASTNTCNVVS